MTGRFLVVDPVTGTETIPQSWNRYAYTRGNPLKFIDPNGEDVEWFARDDAEGSLTNFGHSALRVLGEGYDVTYDFGRYGKTWGVFKSEGEGILRVWSDFSAFLAGQRDRGNSILAHYETSAEFDHAVMTYFAGQIAAAKQLGSNTNFTTYRLAEDYDLSTNNCTTICASALASALRRDASEQDAKINADTRKIFSRTVDPREIFKHLDASRAGSPTGMTIYYYSYTPPKK
jgi:hypothetical protein